MRGHEAGPGWPGRPPSLAATGRAQSGLTSSGPARLRGRPFSYLDGDRAVTDISRSDAATGRRPALAMALASVLSLSLGLFLGGAGRSTPAVADDHAPAKAAKGGVKAPIEEVLHCPLAFAGVHLMKDSPGRS